MVLYILISAELLQMNYTLLTFSLNKLIVLQKFFLVLTETVTQKNVFSKLVSDSV